MASYTVVAGDTLGEIAAANGISLSALLAANPQISNPNLIYPGQSITIPTSGGGSATFPGGGTSPGVTDPGDSPTNPVQPPGTIPGGQPGVINPGGTTQPGPPAPVTGPSDGGGTGTPPSVGSGPSTGGGVDLGDGLGAAEFGLINFQLLTENGPVTVPIFFPPSVWAAILASPIGSKYGFDVGITDIPIGQSKNFINDINANLTGTSLTTAIEKLSSLDLFDEITLDDQNLPPISPEMAASGIAWVTDPVTGAVQLVDTQPFFGPPLSSFHFVPSDPNNPGAGGQWQLVQDPDMIGKSVFEGVPKSVEPWLQAALDAGGDISVVPEGPARAWVSFLIGQAESSSGRPPTELPFGFGLPEAGAGTGAEVPEFPGTQPPPTDVGASDGSGAPPELPDSGDVVTPETVIEPRAEGGGGFAPTVPIGETHFTVPEGFGAGQPVNVDPNLTQEDIDTFFGRLNR